MQIHCIFDPYFYYMKIRNLFGNRNKIISIEEKGLEVIFKDTSEENYREAIFRKKINDFRGALLYCDKITVLNPNFQKADLLKMQICIELRSHESSAFNLLEAMKLDDNTNQPLLGKVNNTITNVFVKIPKEEREEFKYLKWLIKNKWI